MSTEISRHSAGASAWLTFPLPVIYIREKGSWGIFCASQGRGSDDSGDGGGGLYDGSKGVGGRGWSQYPGA